MNRHSRVMVAVTFLLSAIGLIGQDSPPFPALADLERRFEEAFAKIEQPVKDLNGSFAQALQRLMEAETARGSLDGALKVQREIEGFGDGSTFATTTFLERKTDHEPLANLRSKYLTERERLWKLGTKDRDDLRKSYTNALLSLEQEQTRLNRLDLALVTRQTREKLAQDPRFKGDAVATPEPTSFPAMIHFVAKGEVELRHNGARLSFRNTSPDRDKYIEGTSAEIRIAPGDVIHLRMRATAVFRSIVMTVESRASDRCIPFATSDYRYVGIKADTAMLNPKVEELLKIDLPPDAGAPDGDMSEMWNGKSISNLSRTTAEWIKCGPGNDWHDYAIVIQREMILTVPSE